LLQLRLKGEELQLAHQDLIDLHNTYDQLQRDYTSMLEQLKTTNDLKSLHAEELKKMAV
jgi:hypothetical protein